ncbi:DUF4371 domain-containing protein [Aphis craccivora]|uniref:DUF4371 domain-containing protein n=1 Tax=Aphis craccivora TaxID=307492 RepID=A0A6G0YB53_APHCR|nr:DUF4371 domain-containing protein [Aphis craccivora]
MVGIGTDNASVMVGINMGVYQKLKEDNSTFVPVPCVCHSLQLAIKAAADETLPRHLEFLIRETYNWFSHSTIRQNQYKLLYKTINDGHNPLKIMKSCGTRWLSIESVIFRILDQWLELKTLFGIARLSEKCYKAEVLYQIYNDDQNLAYLKFLKPILSEVQAVNKAFESNSANLCKLLSNLSNLVRSLQKKIINPNCKECSLTIDIEKHLHPKPYLGYSFEKRIEEIKIKPEYETILRNRCAQFLITFKTIPIKTP